MKCEISDRKRVWAGFCAGLGALALVAGPAWAGTVVQDFYVPLPEAQIYTANNAIVSGTGSTIVSTISIHVVTDNTVIYYDQWEDGYETSLGGPTQSSTRIWGDGNDAHGIPPGMVHNPLGLPAGTIITLTNAVATQPRNPAVLQYDGRDHIGATRPIVVTRAHWPSTTGTVIAGAVSVLSTAQWGTNYVSPVGQNMTNGLMGYVGLFVQAMADNTLVTIDPTGTNGAGITNIVLNQGESYLYNGGILKGGRATASAPVQADLVIGHKNATYAVDWFNLYPVTSWGSTYYTPVGSAANGQPAYVYLYNPSTNVLTLKVTTKVGVSSVTVPGTNGLTQFTMPANSGASFVATNGQAFYAICTVNAAPATDTTWNWGFSLVPTQILTTEEDVGWAPGSSDGTVNGSPVWVTPLAATTLYVVYGDNTNLLTDPAGGHYNTNFNLTAFQSLKIYDPSRNQTGMRIYTLDGTLITAAWGEDSDVAAAGNPYIDAGYTVLPFPVPTLQKTVANLSNPGQAVSTNGTLLLYTVTIGNNNLVPLEGIVLRDLPSTRLQYVPGSTTNFTSLATNALADRSGGFPLLSPGYTNGVIQAQSSITFTYLLKVTNNLGAITNLATIPSSISGAGLITSLTANTTLPVAGYVPPVVNFTDGNGVATNAYPVGLTNIYVTITDTNANLSATAVNIIQATVQDTNTGDYEVLTLTETGVNTSVFRNTNALPSSLSAGLYPNDGFLNGASGNGLVVTYIAGNGTAYTTNATLTGSSGGAPALTKQLYLDSTNGTAQALNRFDPVHYGFGTTQTSADIGGGWPYHQTITVNHAKVSGTDQTNFPVLVSLSANAGLQAHAQSSGNDILFTASDGITILPYEREQYANGTLVAWVKVPLLSHTADTVLVMYYGNSTAGDQQNKTGVWDSNYQGVWHLNQTPNATKPDMLDSTSGGNNGSSQGSPLPSQNGGQIGGSLTLSSAGSDYISTANSFAAPPLTVTVQAWIKTTTTSSNKIVGLELNQTGTGSGNADRQLYLDAKGHARFGTWNTSGNHADLAVSTSAVNDGNWHSVVGVRDNTVNTNFIYVDGVLQAITNSTSGQTYTGYWRIGSYAINASQWGGAAGYFNGSVDEVRVSQSARSAGWIATEYSNLSSPAAFYAFGSEATGPASVTSFVQSPAFALPFTLPSGGSIAITNYITVTNGSFAATPNITAFLLTNGVTFLTLTSPTYNSGVGVNTNLVWTGTLGGNVTIPSGTAITYVLSNNVAGTAFHVNYGSGSNPSVIALPASPSTVISIDSFGVYDAPYPGGNPVGSPVAGTPLYIRGTVSDPFGAYDISSVSLAITAPGGGLTSVNASQVASTSTNAVYEYAWSATTAVGNYSIVATANEGTEGITDTATATLTTAFLDQGTPNTTTFTSGDNGASTNAYPLNNGTACILVQDLSANTNSLAADSVTVTVASSAGGSIQVALTETGTNTGSFANCFNTTTVQANTNTTTLYAPSGAVLTANYSSLTSPAFQSSATAIIEPATLVSSLAVTKTVVSPSGGQAVLGNQVTYNVYVLNNGSTTLSGLAVTDSYPSQLTFTNASPAVAITNLAGRQLIWTNLGPFTPGQGTNLLVTFATTNASPATNFAWAGGGAVTTIVTNSAPLAILNPAVNVFKTVLNPVATNQIGSNVVFQIVITNSGNTTIASLPMEDNFSGACFQFVSNNIVSTNAAAITGSLPASGYGSLVWTNLAPTNGLAPGGVITNDVTLLVAGQGYPAVNTAIVDYAVDTNGLAVPSSSSSIGVTNAAASILGYVYNDPGQTGTYSASDIGLSGFTISFYLDNNNVPGALVGITTTAANGSYQFLNLTTNKYLVVEALPQGYAASSAVNVVTNVAALVAYNNVNFFAYVLATTNYASLSGSVTNDLNWNGVANVGESGLANVTINLVQDLNSNGLAGAGEPVVASTTTDTNGNYSFTDLTPGRYVIQEAVPYGYYATNVTLGTGSTGFLAATNAAGVLTNFTQIGLVLTNGQNSFNNNFLMGEYQLSGTVWDDFNGLTDNLVNGVATNATGAPLYVNLLNAGSNVLASAQVATNGAYVFTNLVSGTYLLELSQNAGTVAAPAPAMVLPAGWVNMGGSTNGTIAGNTNGFLTVQLVSALTSANFGVDALPTSSATNATYVNPGGTNTVNVPGLTGTDPEQGTLGGATNRVLIATVPGNATLYYNGVVVTAGQTITNYNPSLLAADPGFEGAGSVVFSFSIEDAAGQASASAAAATVTFTGVSLGGIVYEDRNGLTDGLVNGAATNNVGVPLYVNLLNANSNVLATVPVGTNGTFSFASVSSGNDLVELTEIQGNVGSAAPAVALPAGWVNVGGSTNGVIAGNTNGLTPVTILAANVSNVNFGLDALPTAVATNATYVNPGGTNRVVAPGFTGTDPEQGALGGATNTVVMTTASGNATLYYNGVVVTAGQTIPNYNPSLLTVDPGFEGAGTVLFTYQIEDAAGQASSGAATVNLTFTAVSLSGTVFDDANGLTDGLVNGVATNAVGTPLYANLINGLGIVLASVPVATNGAYTIPNLSSGVVTVQLSTNAGSVGVAMPATVLPTNWVNTGESTNGVTDGLPNGLITLTLAATPWNNVNFGVAPPVTIGGYTWLDVNRNGLQDPGEPALGGVAVAVYQTNGLTHAMTALVTNVSSLNGQYLFTNLPPGSYQLLFTAPASGYTYSPAGQGNPTNDSAANASTGFTPLLTYAAGASDLTEDAGFEPNATAVTGVVLQAFVNQGQAWVAWQTYNEAGLLAFDVTRSAVGGTVQDVTPDWVFASGLDLGASYAAPDPGATLPGTYTYNLYGYYDNGTVQALARVQVQLAAAAPTNSTLQVLSFTVAGNAGMLRWSGGQPPYVVEQSSSLGADAVWQTVGTTTNATQLAVPLTGRAGFYRVQTGGN